MAHISRSLRKDREVSLYGDEALGLPPERVFTQVDADEALEEAEFVFELTRRLFDEYPQLPGGQGDTDPARPEGREGPATA